MSVERGLPTILSAVLVMADPAEPIRFQACNPKRQKTGAWERYEKYKIAITIGEGLKLGATTGFELKLGAAVGDRGDFSI